MKNSKKLNKDVVNALVMAVSSFGLGFAGANLYKKLNKEELKMVYIVMRAERIDGECVNYIEEAFYDKASAIQFITDRCGGVWDSHDEFWWNGNVAYLIEERIIY